MFRGWQKISLVDYPGKVVTTLFTGGCNMRCGFCHNPGLVLRPGGLPPVAAATVLAFLAERRPVLDGVCITGGEPALHAGLPAFMAEVKGMGLAVKLDTNGSNPEFVQEVLSQGLVDYVAMDLKTRFADYPAVTRSMVDPDALWQTRDLIVASSVEREFRTTLIRELHPLEVLKAMAANIAGERYYLQNFRNAGELIDPYASFHPYSREEAIALAEQIAPYCEVRLRGF